MIRKAIWLLELGLLLIFSLPLAILPLKISIKAGDLLGLLLFYIWGSRRKIAVENIKHSELRTQNSRPGESPEATEFRRIAKETFKNLGRSFAEVLKIYYGLGNRIIDSVEIEGIENFKKAESKGKGVLFITGHCGNWELMAVTMSARISEAAVVARPINNLYLNRLIERIRQKYGNSLIYKKGAVRGIIKRLRDGGCVGILIDQAVLSDEGYVIDFLGRGAWTTKMPALIARKTGAAVLPAFIHRTSKGHKFEIYPEIELSDISDNEKAVIEDTKRFSYYIEKYITEHPDEWLWIHRRWKRV